MRTNFKGIFISGETIRTNNQSPDVLLKHWQDFMTSHLDYSTIYAIYSNYETDFTGNYDFSIGSVCQEDATTITLPSGNYFIWDTNSQNPQDVMAAWELIWKQTDLPRAYLTDFEVYEPNQTIKIYLSVNELKS